MFHSSSKLTLKQFFKVQRMRPLLITKLPTPEKLTATFSSDFVCTPPLHMERLIILSGQGLHGSLSQSPQGAHQETLLHLSKADGIPNTGTVSGNLKQGSRIHCLEKCCFLKDVSNSAYCSEIWPIN